MLKFKNFSGKLIVAIMMLSLMISSFSPGQARALILDPSMTNTNTDLSMSTIDDGLTDADLEELATLGYSIEEFNYIVEILEISFEDTGMLYDDEGLLMGYDEEFLAEELEGNPYYIELILTLKKEGLLSSQYNQLPVTIYSLPTLPLKPIVQGDDFITTPGGPTINPNLTACAWVGMKNKPEYVKNESNCISGEIKKNFNYIAISSMIANLIAAGAYQKAAKEIAKLAVKSNIWGIVVTLTIIRGTCIKKMEKMYPGRTNCIAK